MPRLIPRHFYFLFMCIIHIPATQHNILLRVLFRVRHFPACEILTVIDQIQSSSFLMIVFDCIVASKRSYTTYGFSMFTLHASHFTNFTAIQHSYNHIQFQIYRSVKSPPGTTHIRDFNCLFIITMKGA